TGLVLIAEIEAVERIVTHRIRARRPFAGIRQPECGIARLRHLRDAPFDLLPRGVEVLQNGFALRAGRRGQERDNEQEARKEAKQGGWVRGDFAWGGT